MSGKPKIVFLEIPKIPSISDIRIAEAMETLPDFDEKAVVKHLKAWQEHFMINIGIGRGKARVWSAL
jgi:hypothetical protein